MPAFACGFVLALLLAVLAARLFRGRTKKMLLGKAKIIGNAIGANSSAMPDIVTIGGGTGLSTLLSGLKAYTRNITAVVAVTDEGGSSGRLRSEWGMLPPGDIRNCIVALAENDSSLNALLNYRFDRGELQGHSLGNLMLLAATELKGDFQRAVEELNKLLAIRGRVLPVTTENIKLKGIARGGEELSGELEISNNGSRLEKLWIEPSSAKPVEAVKEAIKNADLVVLGPGSLFTSVMPNLLLKEIVELLRETRVPVVYIANLVTQPKETEGMNILAHVDWIAGVTGSVPDYLLANQAPVPEEFLKRYGKIGAEPLYLSAKEEKYLSSLGTKVIYGNYIAVKDGKYLRHNAQNLAETIMLLAREYKERKGG